MKFLKYFRTNYILRFRSMNSVIALSIFVVCSFLLGIPIGQNKIRAQNDILNNYNYQVLMEIPKDNQQISSVINEVVNKECRVINGNELSCAEWTKEEAFEKQIEFKNEATGITKRLTLVLDIFDFKKVYLGTGDDLTNYNINKKFRISDEEGSYKIEENVENYLLVLATDAIYFQAHPFGTSKAGIIHNGTVLKEESIKVFYQNNLPDFSINKEQFKDSINGQDFGRYILDQILIGNKNVLRLKAFTLSFIVCVFFTLTVVLIIWSFFRKGGKLTTVSEYYNIAAIVTIPIFIIFFALLWFISSLIYLYIFAFSLLYLLVIYGINSKEEII